MKILGLIICMIAGGLAYKYGGWTAVTAVILGEIGVIISITQH